MPDYAPDKDKTEAIAAILGSSKYVVIVESDTDPKDGEDKSKEPTQYGFFFNDYMGSFGLIAWASSKLKKSIDKMGNEDNE